MSWLGRPSSYPSANEGGFTTRRLLVSSVSFWLALSALGLIFLMDFNIAPNLQVSPFASWQNVQSFLYCLIVFALMSGLIGVVGALPSALINKIFSPQIESLYRRSWSLPKARIVIFKYSSLGLLILSNFLLLSLSLGTAPQYARGRSNQPGIIATWSQFIYDLLYVPRLRGQGQEVVAKLNAQNSAKTYVVFVPASVMSQPDVFVRVRKEIGEPIPFLADAPDFSTQMIQMLDGSPDFYQTYTSPILTRGMLSPEQANLSLSAMLGLSEQHLNLRLAPEFGALEAVLSGAPFMKASHVENGESDAQLTLKKRLVLSQPHLFLPFRIGLGEVFDKNWEWTKLIADDSMEIINALNLQSHAQPASKALTIIQLDELEQVPTSLFHPYASLRWPVISSLLEKQKIVSRSDELLSALAASVKRLGATSLFILPYPDLKTTRQLAWSFVYLPDEHPLKTRFVKNLKTYGWLTGLAAADYLRMSVAANTAEDTDLPNNDTLCQPMLYAFGKNDATQTLQHAWSFVSFDANQNFTVASDLRFLFKTRSNYAVFCKNVATESVPSRTNGYIFQFLTDENLNLRDRQLLAALFQTSTKIELSADKKNKNKEPTRAAAAAEMQAVLLSKLKIYRIMEQDFRQFDVSPLAGSQVEGVMKTYYNDFIKVSLDISHGQLFWD